MRSSTSEGRPRVRLLISDEQKEAAIGEEMRALILQALDEALASEPPGAVRQALAGREAEVSLTLVDDARMAALNRQYRGLDGTTDVLSFPMISDVGRRAPDVGKRNKQRSAAQNEGPALNTAGGRQPLAEMELLLGDIVISVPRAISQAAGYGNSLEQEMVWLAVHGMLHLLGYDDETGPDALRMMERSRQVMDRLLLGANPDA